MQRIIDLIVATWRYFIWLLLIAFIIFGMLFTIKYRAMIRNQSQVMAFTDSIAAYIQKSGGLILPEGQTKENFFLELAQANGVTSMVCPSNNCMVEIEEKQGTGGDHYRSTVYTVTTRYYLSVPKFPGTGGNHNISYTHRNTRPVVSRAYVTEYKNYD